MKEHGTGDVVRLNFEFPQEHYPYLKMICVSKGMSMGEFATEVLIKAIEEFEDEQLAKKAKESLKEMKEDDSVSWDEES